MTKKKKSPGNETVKVEKTPSILGQKAFPTIVGKGENAVPCFPTQRKKVVQPEQAVPPTKTINRYGETSIRYVGQPLKPEQWKKSVRNPNYGRRLPQVPPQAPPTNSALPPPRPRSAEAQTQSSPAKQQHHQQPPLRADFFISVPIFTETFDHSYRKKYEYVYTDDKDDEISLYHQSLSRASSLRDLSLKGTYRSTESQPLTQTGPHSLKRRPRSAQRTEMDRSGPLNRSLEPVYVERQRSYSGHRLRSRRPQSGSEASYRTLSSRGSYEDVRLEKAVAMKRAPKKRGILIDSDDDER